MGYFTFGAIAGALAGIIGGIFYTKYGVYYGNDNALFRMARVVIVSTPIGGSYGLTLGLFQQNHPILRKHIANCFLSSITIILTVTLFAVFLGDDFPTQKKVYVPNSIISIIIGFFIFFMATYELWDNSLKLKMFKKYIARLAFLSLYLVSIYYLIFFLIGLLFSENNAKIFIDFEFRPENWPNGIMISLFLLFWSASGFFLTTYNNVLTDKLDKLFSK